MGQIFNRIKKIVTSNTRDYDIQTVDFDFFDEDDELKRLIDEAYKSSAKTGSSGFSSDFSKITTDRQACLVLGLNSAASVDEIKLAFKTLIKKYHPDKFANADEQSKLDAERKSVEIIKAYEFLKKTRKF